MNNRIDFKLILLGDSNVGKTSLINKYVIGKMKDTVKSGLGKDFDAKQIELDGKWITLCIWDTAGQERFSSLGQSYYRGADGVIAAYSVTNKASFDHVTTWLDDVADYSGADVNKVLVGPKCDLEEEQLVDYTTGKEYADSLGIPFLQTSAKEGTNVVTAFQMLARRILDRKWPDIEAEHLENARKPKSGGCCY